MPLFLIKLVMTLVLLRHIQMQPQFDTHHRMKRALSLNEKDEVQWIFFREEVIIEITSDCSEYMNNLSETFPNISHPFENDFPLAFGVTTYNQVGILGDICCPQHLVSSRNFPPIANSAIEKTHGKLG